MEARPKKVPVILQMEALECGAASLCMILAYYKKWVPLEQARIDCGVSRDGSNALNIYKAAEDYGLKVKASSYNLEQLQKEARFPAIIWWNRNHFVVLTGIRKGKAYINDPAKGSIVMPMEEFAMSYSMMCMQFEPGENFQKGGKPQSILEFIKSRTVGYNKAFALVLLTGALAVFFQILIPVFGTFFTDEILGTDRNSNWLLPFLILFAIVVLLRYYATFLNYVVIKMTRNKLSTTTSVSFMWHILRMPVSFFEQRYAGDLAGRQMANDQVASTLVKRVLQNSVNVVLLIFYLIVMIRYDVCLTVIGVGATIPNLFLARAISEKRTQISRTQMRDQGRLDAATISGIEMIETIKASGAEYGFFEKWSGHHAAVIRSKTEFSEVNRYLEPLSKLLQTISNLVILGVGAKFIMDKHLTIGMLMAFQSFMNSFFGPANQLISAGQNVHEMKAAMERIEDVMNYPTDVEDTLEQVSNEKYANAKKLSGEITVSNISFGYAKLSPPIIKNFSLNIRPGEKIAIVGSSGSGKSTISKLISGLYQPWEGEIRYDGKLISEIPRPVFVGSVAVVNQDIILFEDTIQNNITMWDDTVKDFEVILAARDAGVHEDILGKKDGYRHKIREGGKDLSGGQRQRIEIARVLSQDPSIIILDEATSALDSKTEFEVMDAISKRGVTCIIVAHRLSTIRDCDEIIVLDKGTVVERGNHEELIKKGGKYKQLVITE